MRIFNKCHLLLLLAAMVLVPQWASAQQAEVSARILDGKTNDPIPGVTVTIPGTSRGTTSGLDGSFRISAAPDEELYFNFIGYESLVMSAADVANRTVIVMNEEATQIDDIVVVGYGTQRKASVVAAISQTKGEELLKSGNITNVAEALQGKLNGVVSINKSGKPGDNDVEIYIRGKGTWHGTSPLVLVDGVERNMNDVDMHEIETISVLKDASATAVYGIRGANGVILLTTKRGTSERPTISFNASFGFKQPTRSLNFSDYVTSMRMYNEAMKNDNNWSNLFSDQTIAAWENAYATGMTGPYSDVFPDIDWQDQMVQMGTSQSYNVNVSGRSDFMSYFASVGYQNDGDIYKADKQDDYDPRHYYRRYNWRSNFDFNLTKTTIFSVKIAGMMGYRNSTFADDFYRSIINAPSNSFPIKYSNGIWGGRRKSGLQPAGQYLG